MIKVECDKCHEVYLLQIQTERITCNENIFEITFLDCPHCNKRYFARVENQKALFLRGMLNAENERYKTFIRQKKPQDVLTKQLNKIQQYKERYSKQCDIAKSEFLKHFPQYRF